MSLRCAVTAIALVSSIGFAHAQNSTPMRITSHSLNASDKDKLATFSGKVRAVEDALTLETEHLTVRYADNPIGSDGQASSGNQIELLEAKNGIVVTLKEQTANADEGVYDLKAKTIALVGNATAVQGDNVVTGHKIIINMITGVTRVEPRPQPGRTIAPGFRL